MRTITYTKKITKAKNLKPGDHILVNGVIQKILSSHTAGPDISIFNMVDAHEHWVALPQFRVYNDLNVYVYIPD